MRAALLVLLIAGSVVAQGFRYRGPGDLSVPSPAAEPADTWDELARWSFWWQFHADEFVWGGAQPPVGDPQVARALTSAVREDLDPRVVATAMIALGKAATGPGEFELLEDVVPRLSDPQARVREAAALALGIARRVEAVDVLVGRVHDRGNARDAAFAAYALGLIGEAPPAPSIARRVASVLAEVASNSTRDMETRIAALAGLGIVRGDGVLEMAWPHAHRVWRLETDPRIRAHALTTVASLCAAGARPALREDLVACCRAVLRDETADARVVESSVLALGRVAERGDDAISALLVDHYERARHAQSGQFALLALGEIGGEANREALCGVLRRGTRALEKPFAALALGVLERGRRATHGIDTEVSALLVRQLAGLRNPETIGALAVAIGLVGDPEAAAALAPLLEKHRNKDELAGELCVALAMLGDVESAPRIEFLVDTSRRRPERMAPAAQALGRLRAPHCPPVLVDALAEGSTSDRKLGGLASGVGATRDPSVVPRLVGLLESHEEPLVRAAAAAALGRLVERGPRPWCTRLAGSVNYRAAVETMIDGHSGVFDQL